MAQNSKYLKMNEPTPPLTTTSTAAEATVPIHILNSELHDDV